MFETIGTLLTIAFWAVTIFLLVGGVILIIDKLRNGNGWDKVQVVIAIIAGFFTFSKVYTWLDSIPWALLFTGCVLGLVLGDSSDKEKSYRRREKEYGLSDAIIDTYCEYNLTKAAVKDAIRESKK